MYLKCIRREIVLSAFHVHLLAEDPKVRWRRLPAVILCFPREKGIMNDVECVFQESCLAEMEWKSVSRARRQPPAARVVPA